MLRLKFSKTAELHKFGTDALILVLQVIQGTTPVTVKMVQLTLAGQ